MAHRFPVANQPRAHPRIVLPCAIDPFAEIDSQISPRFLARFTTQARTDWLTPERMASWLSSVGAGTIRAAHPLAEIGDARGRFRTPASVASLAGVTPTTNHPGKIAAVTFRWGAGRQLRGAVRDFAGDSRRANPRADHLYRQARARGHGHPHAVRILARAWLHIGWHCWHTNTPYDPANHRSLEPLLEQDQQAAARRRATHAAQGSARKNPYRLHG